MVENCGKCCENSVEQIAAYPHRLKTPHFKVETVEMYKQVFQEFSTEFSTVIFNFAVK